MKIKLEVISPVHVGSGIQYQGNAEYLFFEREKVIVLADEKKILELIGPENIQIWVYYIEERKESFLDYLYQRKSDLKPEDLAGRIIHLKGTRTPYYTNTLREQIRSGINGPYLPGSSIKGSIRTALFAEEITKNYKSKGVPQEKLGTMHRFKKKFFINDKPLQQEIFGKNPNLDWLRMLQVGDCYFKDETHAGFSDTLNEKANQRYEIKDEVRQLVEYIPIGANAEFQISIPESHLQLIIQKDPRLFPHCAKELNFPTLIELIQKHSLRLLKNEIKFFRDADLPDSALGLLDFMNNLNQKASSFKENECLLRLGFGTGYRNMTGDWVNDLVLDDDLYDDIANETRRNSKYNHMPLPKSRKIMFDGVLPGYVKLTF